MGTKEILTESLSTLSAIAFGFVALELIALFFEAEWWLVWLAGTTAGFGLVLRVGAVFSRAQRPRVAIRLTGYGLYAASLTLIFGFPSLLPVFVILMITIVVAAVDVLEAKELRNFVWSSSATLVALTIISTQVTGVRTEPPWLADFILTAGVACLFQLVVWLLIRLRSGRAPQTDDEAREALDRFAYHASHDLQEPLRMVTSFGQLLDRDYRDKLDERGRSFLDFMTDGARRAQGLMRGLLEYSRIGNALELVPVQLPEVVGAALENMRAKIEASNAQIVVDAELPTVRGDRALLTRLLEELIDNAIEFAGEKSPSIEISAETLDHEVIVSVRDAGVGFEPRHADRLFQIFQRAHERTKSSGMGVGLAVCRRIADLHGGRIWAASDEGGSTFSMSLSTD